MDFIDFDTMLPIYVDYLGAFEHHVNGIEDATGVVKELVTKLVRLIRHIFCVFFLNYSTVKPVYNDHPWDPKTAAIVARWS